MGNDCASEYQDLESGEIQHNLCPARKVPCQAFVEVLPPGSHVPKDWKYVHYVDAANNWPHGANKLRVPAACIRDVCGIYIGYVGLPRNLSGAEIIA
jgi:hypothetical protein